MLKKDKKGKDMRLRKSKKVNIFTNISSDNFGLTDHFFERWNERIGVKFTSKAGMVDYIRSNYDYECVVHISKDHYLVGGIYVTAIKENGRIIFITTLGTYNENPMLYNAMMIGEYDSTIKQYGKMNLAYAM